MIFNFTKNYKFTTRLQLNNEIVEVVPEQKLLGTIIQDDLRWDSNTSNLVKRANARMRLLHKLSEYKAPREDLKTIYIAYIRSILEQSAVVWHASLTLQNMEDLERVQKSALKIILKNKYIHYNQACELLSLDTLKERRQKLYLSFAQKSVKNGSMIFEKNQKLHNMQTRKMEHFKVTQCNTERLKNSAVPHMQILLNQNIINTT